MAQKKKDLTEYITTVNKIKPSAEVKFKSVDETGNTVEESVASRSYVAQHAEKEFEAASKVDGLSERLTKVTQKAQAKQAAIEEDEIDDIEAEVESEQLAESEVTFRDANAPQEDSPLTHVPNTQNPQPTTVEMSETAILIQLVSKLIDKIDEMQNFNPVIHVPAPVIHVTLPETKRTVTKAVERDENNWIKTVREHVEETPMGEPLIEVETPKRKKQKKDSE